MLLIWARVIILIYIYIYGGVWIESLAQSMSYPGTTGGAVPISTIANRATSPRLHHQQQNEGIQKDGERRARWSYVPLHLVCDEHGYGTNTMHNGAFSIALFISFRRRRQQQ